jgi:uncharacterized RDD family membrane protein YckC
VLEEARTIPPERLDTLQTVELAEGVEVRLRIAGPCLRMFAYALDMVFIAGGLTVIGILVSIVGIGIGANLAEGLLSIILFVVSWFYHIFFECGKRGATPGKRIVGLRVVQPSGAPIRVGQGVIRNFLRVVDILPPLTYGFGLASCLLTKRFQRLGDLAAGTVVVYEGGYRAAQGMAIPPPVAACAPKLLLTREEQSAVVGFRDRAATWSEARRVELSDNAEPLTHATGAAGVARLLAIGHFLQEQRKGAS